MFLAAISAQFLTCVSIAVFVVVTLLHYRAAEQQQLSEVACSQAPQPAADLLPSNCTRPAGDDPPVAWNALLGKCEPDVCRGARLLDLADAGGEVATSVLCGMELLDAAAARSCLRDKRVLLMGDSTMAETAHDIIILLSGVAANRTLLTDYIIKVRRVQNMRCL